MTTNQTRALIFIVAGIIIGLLPFGLSQATADEPPTYIDHILYTCETERVAESLPDGGQTAGIGADLAALLIDAGWQGYQGDGMEKIYSPACQVTVEQDGTVIVKDTEGNIVR